MFNHLMKDDSREYCRTKHSCVLSGTRYCLDFARLSTCLICTVFILKWFFPWANWNLRHDILGSASDHSYMQCFAATGNCSSECLRIIFKAQKEDVTPWLIHLFAEDSQILSVTKGGSFRSRPSCLGCENATVKSSWSPCPLWACRFLLPY